MNIEEFYDADPRRRASREFTYGVGWSDGSPPGQVADLFWVEDTGELYLMFEPIPPNWLSLIIHDDLTRWVDEAQDLAAGAVEVIHDLLHPRHHLAKTERHHPDHAPETDAYTESLIIEILAIIPTKEAVDARLVGWELALRSPDSMGWLRARTDQGKPAST